MRNFFELDPDQNIIVNPTIYSISTFKKILNRDKTKNKKKANLDLAYIFWMCDYRSYISDITDQNEKHKEVISLIDDSNSYKPDKLVLEAMEIYKKDIPLSLSFLNDVKITINELRRYFREVKLDDVDRNGKLIHDSKKVMDNITKTGELLSTLDKHEQKVKKDLDMNNSIQGGKVKGFYED